MATHCFVNPSLANYIVGTGWESFHDLALSTYGSAIEAMGTMSEFYIPPAQPLSITFDLEGYTPGEITLPDAPTRTISAFTMPDLPATVSLGVSPLVISGDAPAAPDTPLQYAPPEGDPGEFDVAPPSAEVDLELVAIPDAPSYTLPTLPTFYELSLPEPPTLAVVPFEGIRPDTNLTPPALTFGYTPTAYSSELVEAVKARLLVQSQGGTGLPAHIESALFDAARRRLDGGIAAAVQGVAEEFSNRGFAEPAPVMARRMRAVRLAALGETAVLNRDLMIRATDLEREQLRDFVAQGTALEQVLIGEHMQREQLTFEAARYLMQATIDLFNATLAKIQAEAQVYEADARVYRERIQAELAKAELYRAEIEGQKAIGEVNEQLARIYGEQVRGVLAMVEIYKASVSAAEARNGINVQRIEAKRAEVQVFAERVRAYTAEWEGYGRRVDAKLGVLRGQELANQVYATQVNAWGTKQNVSIEAHRGQIAAADLRLRGYLADLERFGKQLAGETGRMGAESQALAAEASVYEAGGRVAVLANDAENRSFQLRLQAAQVESELTMEASRANLTLGLERSKLALSALDGIARVATQLAGSMASAVNLSASISASDSRATSCSESFSFQGDISDA